MVALILAGEAVYALPFHVARFFRPTLLEVFGLTATELGAAQGVYGIVAMVAYFPGGPLADRFSARTLLAVSLWSTAVGGLYLATMPGYVGSMFIWAFFGVTTILFFWAALIRATRDWGGVSEQGRAYGLLDSGRGLLAAVLATLGVMVFSLAFPDGAAAATFEQKESALRTVIYGYVVVTAAVGFFVWFAIPDIAPVADTSRPRSAVLKNFTEVIKIRAVWLQAMVLLCAYVAFKGFDNYSLFAVQAWGMDEVEAAAIVTLGSYIRPVAALAAGLLADRFSAARLLFIGFFMVLASDLYFGLVAPSPNAAWILMGNTIIACIAIFGFRSLYFALLEDARVPLAVTGTAIGFVSIIGYTPDIFVAYVAGVFIDASPGVEGHQNFFMFLSAFALLGLIVSFMLMRTLPSNKT